MGSGTVGTGCLLEVKDAILKRYLEPGDTVTLAIERLGELTNPIVERPPDR
ncbi:MAG: fumarylacetoacetate hydrolase family protein [Chloroflexota bacterium]|nr:fumarylacetoacetate hydrolase family protein [Chloroflexota bacterium]